MRRARSLSAFLFAAFLLLAGTGCVRLFGWDIHAPGILSDNFIYDIHPAHERVGLYLDPAVWNYLSKNRGGKLADPQTYHVGEAFAPMAIEGFQQSFEEFIFLETEPTPALLERYGIPYLAVVRIKSFGNRVTLKGQAVELVTEVAVFDRAMQPLGRLEARGSSDAEKIFAKKGGPEVNLNAAIENNITATVQYLQDAMKTGNWKQGSAS
jgi:hypothetical protein